MNQRASWMEQFFQAARMPLWTTLPICHVRTLGLLCWQLHGYREWALPEPSSLAFALMLRDILTDALFCRGVEGAAKWQVHSWELYPVGVGKLLAPLSAFLSFFQKTLNSGNVSNRPYTSVSYFRRLTWVPPQELVVSPVGGHAPSPYHGDGDFDTVLVFMTWIQLLFSLWVVWASADDLLFPNLSFLNCKGRLMTSSSKNHDKYYMKQCTC